MCILIFFYAVNEILKIVNELLKYLCWTGFIVPLLCEKLDDPTHYHSCSIVYHWCYHNTTLLGKTSF